MNKKRINYEDFKTHLNKKEFIDYYSRHNIATTANFYNTNPQNIIKYCKEIKYIKDKIEEKLNNISAQELTEYYINWNHSYKETLKHFNLNNYSFNKLLKIYNIHKK